MNDFVDILEEPRWPHESDVWPRQWNRAAGLFDMMVDFTGVDVAFDKDFKLCEIGVANGVSTEIFSRFGDVIGVDNCIWDKARTRFEGRENVKLLWMDSLAAADTMAAHSFDLVYLDSRHDYEWVRDEIRAWRSKVKSGGAIAGHDYSPEFPGVQQAVAEELGGPDMVYHDSSWIVRLKD